MTASRLVVTKLLTVSRMSKVDYRNKVSPIQLFENLEYEGAKNKLKTKNIEKIALAMHSTN